MIKKLFFLRKAVFVRCGHCDLNKIILPSLAAACIFMLTACSTNDTFEDMKTPLESEYAIGFGSYLNQLASTRGTAYLEPADIALNGDIGIFALYTNGGKYGSTNFPNFSPNFMKNIKLSSSLTEEELKGDDADVANSWVYSPIRYWPLDANDYVSFLAYAPYSASQQLYTKEGNTTGDLKYIKHTISSNPKNHIDLLYADATDIANMQLYPTKSEKGFYQNSTNVDLKLKHATSRIGFVVTSSALLSPYNYGHYDGEEKAWWSFGQGGLSGSVTPDLEPCATITINKVEFLGDNSSAESETPKSAFTHYAYLNLASTNDDDLWVIPNTNDGLSFVYDNTTEIRTVNGEIGDGSGHSWKEGDVTGTTGKYKWLPQNSAAYRKIYEDWARQDYESYGISGDDLEKYVNYDLQQYDKLISENGHINNVITGRLEPIGERTWADEATVEPVGNGGDDYMFIIPQDFSESSGNNLWVYLDYTVNYAYGVSGDVKDKGINYKVYRKINKKFEPGKAYIIVMDIGKNNENGTILSFNAINFTVQLDNWKDEEGVNTSSSN